MLAHISNMTFQGWISKKKRGEESAKNDKMNFTILFGSKGSSPK